jgi:3-hydroxyisobutyrate dehydrogenase-like beta-hydroxyacid dehydrogenase
MSLANGSEHEAKPTIGFIGLGRMGSRMARRLLDAGYPLGVYNRTPEKAEPLALAGARVYDTPRQLAATSSIVMSSLADDTAVEQALLGDDGALAGARPGTVLVDLSSIYPTTSRTVHQVARAKGVAMLDAPVSGSTGPAQEGRLVILVGGERDTYESCRPIFDVLGRASFYLGPSGAGSTMKLVVNAVLGVEMQALAEAIALGEKAGLPSEGLLDVLGETGVVSAAHQPKLDNARRDQYPATFPLPLMWKDLGNTLQLAREREVAMPATAAALQMYVSVQATRTDEDYSVVLRLMRELADGAGARPPASGAMRRTA